jgi:hypothetical protein
MLTEGPNYSIPVEKHIIIKKSILILKNSVKKMSPPWHYLIVLFVWFNKMKVSHLGY